MPARPLRSTDRTEARRRARLAARSEEAVDGQEDTEQPAPAPRQSLFERLVPPAPPLRGKGDPLAGFAYQGPFSPVVTALYLLRRNPIAWLVPGLIWLLAQLAAARFGDGGTVSLVTSIAQYVALIAAGWIGWQRPWLFGVTAAIIGWLAFVAVALLSFPQPNANPGQIVSGVAFQTLLQLMVGFVAGWYGGYLRRRLADQRPAQATARARRR